MKNYFALNIMLFAEKSSIKYWLEVAKGFRIKDYKNHKWDTLIFCNQLNIYIGEYILRFTLTSYFRILFSILLPLLLPFYIH